MDKKVILITGARGFIGRHVARHLGRDGYLVRGIGHGRWQDDERKAWCVSEWLDADVSLDALRQFAGTPYAVVHCAGSGSVASSISNPLEDFQRTVATTAHLLDYVRQHSPSTRIVYPSSAGVYGVTEQYPITEDCPWSPISPYGVHKCMTEQLMGSYARQYQISCSIVRLFSVYGCGQRKLLLWDACRKLAGGDPVFSGTGDEIRDWMHVEDAAELLALGIRKADPQCPAVNGATGEGVSVRAVLEQCARSLGPCTPEPVFSGVRRAGDPSRYIADITRARLWGWAPKKCWQEGVAEYSAWWRREECRAEKAHS